MLDANPRKGPGYDWSLIHRHRYLACHERSCEWRPTLFNGEVCGESGGVGVVSGVRGEFVAIPDAEGIDNVGRTEP